MAGKKEAKGGISKYQKFDTEVIHRSQIKNAEYNPRIMDKNAKARLKKISGSTVLFPPSHTISEQAIL